MTTPLTLRSVKGSPLTSTEGDDNLIALRTTADGAQTAMAAAAFQALLVGDTGAALIGYLAPYTGAAATTQALVNARTCYPEDFGAIISGVTDARVPIQAAIDAMAAAGGGTVLLQAKTYLLGSFATYGTHNYYTIVPKSGVSIKGVGPASVIKVANGLRSNTQGITVLYDHENYFENCIFSDFTVDWNGANNLNTFGSANSNINRMGGACGMVNVRFNNLTHKNAAGAHCIYVSNGTNTSNAVQQNHVAECNFSNVGNAIAGNANPDHSSIYMDSDHSTVVGNTFIQPNLNDDTSTAIETHGSVIVAGNKSYGYRVGANLGADVRNVRGLVLNDNTFDSVVYGVQIFTTSAFTYTSVLIEDNTFKLRDLTGVNPSGIIASTTTMAGSVNGGLLTIKGNIFEGPTTPTLTLETTGISLQRWDDVLVEGNQFYNFPGEGVRVESEAARALKRYKIRGNKFRTCGISSNASYKSVIKFLSGVTPGTDDIQDVEVEDNQIICDAGTGTVANYGVLWTSRSVNTQVLDNVIKGAATSPIYLFQDTAAGDVFFIRGKGAYDPQTIMRATLQSEWVNTTTGILYRATFNQENGKNDVWLGEFKDLAIPTTNFAAVAFRRGDHCTQCFPAVGSPKGWFCTVGGTPGTWVSEGNL